ncbi:tRNA lysidine(34) synthetase TilS [Rhodohalobacter sp.]|uniref:tRNA lysidine(34) synthetase TilS n=1 Tax=Rhodohalobacter sp. TaxID=1974210 RepID=UPI0035655C18
MSKFESSPVAKAFQKSVNNYLPDSTTLIAGVSGGPDSMALMYLLHRLELSAVIVHCNYQMRGEDSDKDQRLVEKMSAFWGFECVSVRLEKESASNFQEWARERRYEVFYDLKHEFDADFVTTAHHQDDQIETILQRILRGSGISAWSGIKPIENQLFRPLMDVSKSEIMKFAEEFNIPYRIDNSNEESTYARNFLRHNWFPELQNFFPGWRDNILKLSLRATEFELMTGEVLKSVKDDDRSLSRSYFLNLPDPIRPPVLYQFLDEVSFDIRASSSLQKVAEKLTELQSGKAIQLSGEYQIIRDRNLFTIQKLKSERKPPVKISSDDLKQIKKVYGLHLKVDKFTDEFTSETLSMDLSKIAFPITIRQWEEGDFIRPLGMEGTQLISDHLTNRKISSARKSEAFVIESFDGNICAVIFPHHTSDDQLGTISEQVRCSTETEKVLVIRNQT